MGTPCSDSSLLSKLLFSYLFFFSSLQIWEGLTQRFHRVIALDFVGFGFSDKPVRSLERGATGGLGIGVHLGFISQFLPLFEISGKGMRHSNNRRDKQGS